MKIKRIDADKSQDRECERIVIQVGEHQITLVEKFGQLEVFGDGSDLQIACGSRNSFTVVAIKR